MDANAASSTTTSTTCARVDSCTAGCVTASAAARSGRVHEDVSRAAEGVGSSTVYTHARACNACARDACSKCWFKCESEQRAGLVYADVLDCECTVCAASI